MFLYVNKYKMHLEIKNCFSLINKKITSGTMFGPHLTLDMYNCNKEKLQNYNLVYKLLDELPAMINMHKFSDPMLTIIPKMENSFDQGGLTGFVILVESHISIHTFPADLYVSIDIFSCNSFDGKKAVDYIKRLFEAEKIEFNMKRRGKEYVKHYPKNIKKAQKAVFSDRNKAVSLVLSDKIKK